MIGIVVVTHGQFATELFDAGERERIAARIPTLGAAGEIERFLLDVLGRLDVVTEVNTR